MIENSVANNRNVGAVFPDRDHARAAITELRAHGLVHDQLGAAIRQPDGDLFLEADPDREMAHGIERGILIGAPIGAIAGMTMLALLVPGVGTWGVGGILAAGGCSGALAGTYLGAFLGLAVEEHVLDEAQDWELLPTRPGEVLVVSTPHDHPIDVAAIMRRHDGRIVERPAHRP
jgi:hypothetical protein